MSPKISMENVGSQILSGAADEVFLHVLEE